CVFVGKARRRPFGGGDCAGDGPVDTAASLRRFVPVVGQIGDVCVVVSPARLLEKLGDAMVKRDTSFGGQALVERLAYQCVAEAPSLSDGGHRSDEAGKTRTPEHLHEPVRPAAQCSESG